jgi:hypothetical protein
VLLLLTEGCVDHRRVAVRLQEAKERIALHPETLAELLELLHTALQLLSMTAGLLHLMLHVLLHGLLGGEATQRGEDTYLEKY